MLYKYKIMKLYEYEFLFYNWTGVIYQIRRVELADGQTVFCMWLSRDPNETNMAERSMANLTLASSFNSTHNASALHNQSSFVAEGETSVSKVNVREN